MTTTTEYRIIFSTQTQSGVGAGNGVTGDALIFLISGADIAEQFSGFTLLAGNGAYLSDGRVSMEPSYTLIIFADNTLGTLDRIRDIANRIRRVLSQESVLIIRNPVEMEFVSHDE